MVEMAKIIPQVWGFSSLTVMQTDMPAMAKASITQSNKAYEHAKFTGKQTLAHIQY